MRDIKFRAYSKSFNTMFNYDMLQMATAEMVDICNEKLKAIVPEATKIQMGLFLPIEDEDLTFMQYTGLKDKNGQEIYEGDILKGTTKWKIDEVLAIAYVKWDRGQFDLFTDAPRGSWEDSLFNYMKFYDVEVLGNIYEDSDLLY